MGTGTEGLTRPGEIHLWRGQKCRIFERSGPLLIVEFSSGERRLVHPTELDPVRVRVHTPTPLNADAPAAMVADGG